MNFWRGYTPFKGRHGRLKGSIDHISQGNILSGWAVSEKDTHLDIAIIIDNQWIGKTCCDDFRRDLKDQGISEGLAAFELALPISYFDDRSHDLKILTTHGDVIATATMTLIKQVSVSDLSHYQSQAFYHREIYLAWQPKELQILVCLNKKRAELKKKYINTKLAYKVTIIMAVYNGSHVLSRSINSILDQTYENFELIIVDDGSTDETSQIISTITDSRITLIKFKKNQGVSAARNMGLTNSTGELIAYLDSDNTWHSDYLLLIVGIFTEHEQVDTLYTGQYLFRQGQATPFGLRVGGFDRALLENSNFIDLNCFSHRKKLYKSRGGFDTKLRRFVDWDLILRYTEHKSPYYLDCILSDYFYSNAQSSISVRESLITAASILQAKIRANTETYKIPDYRSIFGHKVRHAKLRSLPKSILSAVQQRPVTVIVHGTNNNLLNSICIASLIKTVDTSLTNILLYDDKNNKRWSVTIKKLINLHPELFRTIGLVSTGISDREIYDPQQLVDAGCTSDIVIYSCRCYATKRWLPELQKSAYNRECVGISGPRMTRLPGSKSVHQHVPFCNSNYETSTSVSAVRDNFLSVKECEMDISVKWITFGCAYIKKSLTNTIGIPGPSLIDSENLTKRYCRKALHIASKQIIVSQRSKVYEMD